MHGINMLGGASRWGLKAMMNFVDFEVFNGSAAEFTNINAGGVDVAAGSSVTATLTAAEILAVAQLDGAAVMQVSATAAEKRAVAEVIDPDTFSQAQALYDAIDDYSHLAKDAAVAAWAAR